MTLTTNNWALAKDDFQKSNCVFNHKRKCFIMKAHSCTKQNKFAFFMIITFLKIILFNKTNNACKGLWFWEEHTHTLSDTHTHIHSDLLWVSLRLYAAECLIQREFPVLRGTITAQNTALALIRFMKKTLREPEGEKNWTSVCSVDNDLESKVKK